MTMKDNHIVLTTINHPYVLHDLYNNLSKHGHIDTVVCWVVGDNKTPESCYEICREVSIKGFEVNYLDIEQQDTWGTVHPDFYKTIPYDNETRRNIGYLFALEAGCKRLICIDDDNFPMEDDFIGGHLSTSQIWKSPQNFEEHGFHNICEYLKLEPERKIYPRGFPFNLRYQNTLNSNKFIEENENLIVGVTAGLWLGAPDIDATTWLNGNIQSIAYCGPDKLVLSQDTWSPINTQNTSITRELIPAFFCIPMGQKIAGLNIGRYGDIWAGYILQAIIKGTSYRVSFGKPIVEHKRNSHNFLNDLSNEFLGIILTDWFVEKLKKEFTPSGKTITQRMVELSDFMLQLERQQMPEHIPEEMSDFIRNTAFSIRQWSRVCELYI
jgi:hypothetical protein